jgi:hypothetical protein
MPAGPEGRWIAATELGHSPLHSVQGVQARAGQQLLAPDAVEQVGGQLLDVRAAVEQEHLAGDHRARSRSNSGSHGHTPLLRTTLEVIGWRWPVGLGCGWPPGSGSPPAATACFVCAGPARPALARCRARSSTLRGADLAEAAASLHQRCADLGDRAHFHVPAQAEFTGNGATLSPQAPTRRAIQALARSVRLARGAASAAVSVYVRTGQSRGGTRWRRSPGGLVTCGSVKSACAAREPSPYRPPVHRRNRCSRRPCGDAARPHRLHTTVVASVSIKISSSPPSSPAASTTYPGRPSTICAVRLVASPPLGTSDDPMLGRLDHEAPGPPIHVTLTACRQSSTTVRRACKLLLL